MMGMMLDMVMVSGFVDYSNNCIQPLSLGLSSALIHTPAIINWNASNAQAAMKPTMARPVTTLSADEVSSSPAIISVGACDGVEDGVALSGCVGGWRLTVAFGNAAVAAAAPSAPGLVEVENGLLDVDSLMVGAGAAGRAVFNAIVGAGVAVAGLLATGMGGADAGGTVAAGAVALGGSGAFADSSSDASTGFGGSGAAEAGIVGGLASGFGASMGVEDGGTGGVAGTAAAAGGVDCAAGAGLANGGGVCDGGPVRTGGSSVGGWLAAAGGVGVADGIDGPLVVAEPGAGIADPGTGGLMGWTDVVEPGRAAGASAAFRVTRTVSLLSGMLEVLETGNSGSLFTETAPLLRGGRTVPVCLETGTLAVWRCGGLLEE